MEKLVGYIGWWTVVKDRFLEHWMNFKSNQSESNEEIQRQVPAVEVPPDQNINFRDKIKYKLKSIRQRQNEQEINRAEYSDSDTEDFSHIYRTKTRKELMKISASVMGIEFSYAVETAFVSPLLLNIGVRHKNMTRIWCLSPILGLFLTPILGSLSDGCHSKFGRRRPFIFLLSLGIICGLLLVPNGKPIGILLGDSYPDSMTQEQYQFQEDFYLNQSRLMDKNADEIELNLTMNGFKNTESTTIESESEDSVSNHPWGLFFSILGLLLLDFSADACQSPSRAYMLDITIPEDHTRGLSTFTIMAGAGGSLGYLLGAFNWENTFIGQFFGSQMRAVFTFVLLIFIACVITTLRSFREIPIDRLWANNKLKFNQNNSVDLESVKSLESHRSSEEIPTFWEYLKTIVNLPPSLKILCLTNFFSWFSLVSYSLYFTDFVGEAVYGGNPTAPIGSQERKYYEDGVRFGSLGMSLYSISCSIYSIIIEHLIIVYGAKSVYIYGHLVYSIGMVLMAIVRHPVGVLLLSLTSGIMYATLFTMPYLLIARYHEIEAHMIRNGLTLSEETNLPRGLGTDVALVSSMVFLAQITQALTLGPLINAFGSTTMIICAASIFAFLGAISASKVIYLDL